VPSFRQTRKAVVKKVKIVKALKRKNSQAAVLSTKQNLRQMEATSTKPGIGE
jgi:hypothetical protein